MINAERRYLGRIRARLQQYKKYPALSRQRGHEGVVRVSFTLAPSGTLMGGVRIVSSSGHHLLDRQARECVLAAAPFPPFPPTLHKTRLTIIVPIAFRLTHGDS
ncbi:MAG: energy transducer TonB [Deltaproteobacteria bacterium]|nr:energy transducer TonB [Deltaproteobacteria bacterium]MBW1952880.1 energy transducer TonB [Deltaproteobacteria bacterium]MBW1985878.1 energy transducer TonB [Deltaproteobacteria bacterium]MBW2133638.1 energy transducer TonB [Deltaproteobacteria bacterium]